MRRSPVSFAILAAALALGACSYKSKSRVVSYAQLGDPGATRIYNFMSTAAGKQETRADSLIDEAAIASLQPGAACFELIVRSDLVVDIHPSEWRVAINGTAASVEELAKATETWDTTYTVEEIVARKTTPRGETTISRPVTYEGTDGITMRRARACAPVAPGVTKLRLDVELKHAFGKEDWGQRYEWTLHG